MRYILIPLLFLLIGCGSTSKKSTQEENNVKDENITRIEIQQEEPIPTVIPSSPPSPTPPPKVIQKNQKQITIYIHGYQEKGYRADYDYGQQYYDTFKTNLIRYTKLTTLDSYQENRDKNFSNLITAVDYYGVTPPAYYSQKDLEEIDTIDKKYNGGIPKYAHIVAKFAKNVLKETNASQINIVSVSMGSLITRWLIEKDVESLVSKNRINKWITIEGIIRGNYALSQVNENSFILNLLIEKSADTKQMRYDWIEENLNTTPSQMNSPNYKNIKVSQISLTNGKDGDSLLKYLLPLNDGFLPNDGVQLYRDSYFEDNLSHTVIHDSHLNVKNNLATFINIDNYLKTDNRIQITLLNASLTDIHEEITQSNLRAEVLFESRLFSPIAKNKWEIDKPIDERVYKSGILPIHSYYKTNTTYALNQILFDGFIDAKEKELEIFLEGFEIDNSYTYDIKESDTQNNRDSIGVIQTKIELKNGIYPISSDEWSGYIKVEVIKPQ